MADETELGAEIARLRAIVADQQRRLVALEHDTTRRGRGDGVHGEPPDDAPSSGAPPQTERRLSRRAALGLAGSGVAAGAVLLRADAAAAADGDAVLAGRTTISGTSTTVQNGEAGGVGIEANMTHAGNPNPALVGRTVGTGNAVFGVITNSSNPVATVHASTRGTGSSIFAEIENGASAAATISTRSNGTGPGVFADLTRTSSSAYAVLGRTAGLGGGVFGLSENANATEHAVLGLSRGKGGGVKGVTENPANDNPAVWGITSGTGPGVEGVSDRGLGVVANGKRGPIWLVPGSGVGAPTSDAHRMGELYIDGGGSLFLCAEDGTPGTWVQMSPSGGTVPGEDSGRVLFINPTKLLHSPSGLGGLSGRLQPGQTFELQATGPYVPSGATGIFGSVRVRGMTRSGFLQAWPTGRPPTPGREASIINWSGRAQHEAAGFAVGLSPAGRLTLHNPSLSPIHVLIDAFAYTT